MSNIDLTNPKVRSNYIAQKIKEGEGEYCLKKDVVIFKDIKGQEYVVPDDMTFTAKQKKKMEVLEKPESEELKEENEKLKEENKELKKENSQLKKNKS